MSATGDANKENVMVVITGSPKKVVSIKLDVDLINEIDRVWQKLGYSSRSEFIREAILYYLQHVTLFQQQLSPSSTSTGDGDEVEEAAE